MKKIFFFVTLFTGMQSFAQWNSNTSLNLEAAGLKSADIHAVSTSDGKTYIAFYQINGANYDMRVQLLDAQGNKLFGPDGMLVSNYTSGSATFVFNADVDRNDNLLIAFQDQRSGSNATVIYKVSPAGALLWGTAGIVLGPGLSPYPVALSNNDVVVAWNNNNNRISLQKISAAGVAAWTTPIEIFPPISGRSISRAQLVAHTGSTFGMLFQQRTGTVGSPTPTNLYEQRFDSNATALWAAPVQISNYVTSNARYFSVMSDADTTYVGYYANPPGQNRFDAFLQRINADGSLPWAINGSSFSTEQVNYEMTTTVAYNPNSSQIWELCTYTNSFQTQYGIYVQRFNKSDGLRQLTDNAKAVYPVSTNIEQQLGNLSLFGDDPVFAFYDLSNKLYASRVNSNGDFVWAPAKTEIASTGNTKFRYSFTKAVNGQAVVVWQENKGIEDRPYAQNINTQGATGTIPVTLTAFNGRLNNGAIQLQWETSSELNCKGFYVEKSSNGRNFENIGFIVSKAVNGVSNLPLQYVLDDAKPISGNNYYRLRQTDLDGKISYSNTILIRYNDKGIALSIYPNPANNIIYATVQAIARADASLLVTDVSGKIMLKQNVTLVKGVQQLPLNLAPFAAGTYFLTIVTKENASLVLKFQKGY